MHLAISRLFSLHIGIPRSARVGPGISSFDCVFRNSKLWLKTSGFPDYDPMASVIVFMQLIVLALSTRMLCLAGAHAWHKSPTL